MSKYSDKKKRKAEQASRVHGDENVVCSVDPVETVGVDYSGNVAKIVDSLMTALSSLEKAKSLLGKDFLEWCGKNLGGEVRSDMTAAKGRTVSACDKIVSAISRLPKQAK